MKSAVMESADLCTSKSSLSISCVTYHSSAEVLTRTIKSLTVSCALARQENLSDEIQLYLIDNGPNTENLRVLRTIKERYAEYFDHIHIKTGHGNVGYGRGHNIALLDTRSEYHLVLNPDVVLSPENISIALRYMSNHPDVGLLAPDAFEPNGNRQYIAKRTPRLLLLIARALRFPWLTTRLSKDLAQYEYHDLIPAKQPLEIELASGCYMFLRAEVIEKTGGFDKRYFMYFEDFDLSRRISHVAKVMHHPQLKIIHAGGSAFSKGIRHIVFFLVSFTRFLKDRH